MLAINQGINTFQGGGYYGPTGQLIFTQRLDESTVMFYDYSRDITGLVDVDPLNYFNEPIDSHEIQESVRGSYQSRKYRYANSKESLDMINFVEQCHESDAIAIAEERIKH